MKKVLLLMLLAVTVSAGAQKPYKCANLKSLRGVSAEQIRSMAAAGDPAAMTQMALNHMRASQGFALDSLKATTLLEEASKKGFEYATILLSERYLMGPVQRDTLQAIALVKALAEKGNAAAKAQLASYMKRGLGGSKDTARALELYGQLEKVGDPYAMMLLSARYEEGFVTMAKDKAKAEMLLRKSYEGGEDEALLLLANLYFNEEEYDKCWALMPELKALGFPEATVREASMYRFGWGVAKDLQRAVELYGSLMAGFPNDVDYKAALASALCESGDTTKGKAMLQECVDANNVWAMGEMARYRLTGKFWDQDYEKARVLLEKALAQKPDYGFGMMLLANLYTDEAYAGRDLEKSLDYCRRLAAEGDGDLSELEGDIYQFEYKDRAKAEQAYLRGAKLGNTDCYTSLMAMMADMGNEAKVMEYAKMMAADGHSEGYYWMFISTYRTDPKAAIGYLKQGEKQKDVASILTLGDVIMQGDLGQKADVKKGLKYYEKAGQLGSGRGYYKMANAYLNGAVEGKTQHALYTAIEYFNKAIELEYTDALYELGEVYENEYYGLKDYDKAVELFARLAKTGDPRGDFKLGLFYELGDGGMPQDSVKAIEFYQRSADAGYNMAKIYLADFYKMGRYLPLDEKKAFELYKETAESGSVEGYYFTGKCYLMGTGVEKDTTMALSYLRPAAEEGLGKACAYMGNFYLHGNYVEKNVDSALYYYHKGSKDDDTTCDYHMGLWLAANQNYKAALDYFLSAGKNGHGEAIVELAKQLQRGQGTGQDLGEAYRLLRVATTYGSTSAYVELGVAEVNGYGCTPDYALAKAHFDTAAMAGNSTGCYDLAMSYENGIGCEPDSVLAIEWLTRAADMNNATALNRLGDYYEEGHLVEQNFEKAFALYERSAGLGSLTGLCNLGYCYEKGEGTVLNSQKAFELYKQAAEGGSARGMYQVANCYVEGIYVEEDYVKAAEWFEKAADNGHYLAQYNLGLLYETGDGGVTMDKKKALKYYNMAAEQGFEPAKAAVEKMKKK